MGQGVSVSDLFIDPSQLQTGITGPFGTTLSFYRDYRLERCSTGGRSPLTTTRPSLEKFVPAPSRGIRRHSTTYVAGGLTGLFTPPKYRSICGVRASGVVQVWSPIGDARLGAAQLARRILRPPDHSCRTSRRRIGVRKSHRSTTAMGAVFAGSGEQIRPSTTGDVTPVFHPEITRVRG